MKSLSEPKHGFWRDLARKAKVILDDDNAFETPGRMSRQMSDTETRSQVRIMIQGCIGMMVYRI